MNNKLLQGGRWECALRAARSGRRDFSGRRLAGSSFRAGFALVAVVSLLMLLMVVMLGLLGLSTVEIRKMGPEKSLSMAQANARLAMLLALGELQRQLGPDQRVSSSGGVLDANPDTPEVVGVRHPHYLGVWDSWDTWLTDQKVLDGGGKLKIQDTYQPGRSPEMFRRWLVSHPQRDWTGKRDAVTETLSGESITLVGSGTLGEEAELSDEVRVSTIPIRDRSRGAIAWWVGDESQKAPVQLHNSHLLGDDYQKLQLRAANPEETGMDSLLGLEGFAIDPDVLARYVTFQSMEEGLPEKGPNLVGRHFNSVSPHSRGLLVDVRSGKLKTDLSLLFEKPKLPQEMASTKLFHGVRATIVIWSQSRCFTCGTPITWKCGWGRGRLRWWRPSISPQI